MQVDGRQICHTRRLHTSDKYLYDLKNIYKNIYVKSKLAVLLLTTTAFIYLERNKQYVVVDHVVNEFAYSMSTFLERASLVQSNTKKKFMFLMIYDIVYPSCHVSTRQSPPSNLHAFELQE